MSGPGGGCLALVAAVTVLAASGCILLALFWDAGLVSVGANAPQSPLNPLHVSVQEARQVRGWCLFAAQSGQLSGEPPPATPRHPLELSPAARVIVSTQSLIPRLQPKEKKKVADSRFFQASAGSDKALPASA